MQDKIEALENEIQALQPLTDDQIQARIEAGEDAEGIINQEQANATRLRVVSVQLRALQKQQHEQQLTEARKLLTELSNKHSAVKKKAEQVLIKAVKAVDALETALAEFSACSKDAGGLVVEMSSVSRRNNLNAAFPQQDLGAPVFSKLQDRCQQMLQPYRSCVLKDPVLIQE